MKTHEIAQKISAAVTDWRRRSPVERAELALSLCPEIGIQPGTVTPPQLAAAMDKMPYWAQGPSNYTDMIEALVAAGHTPLEIHGQNAASLLAAAQATCGACDNDDPCTNPYGICSKRGGSTRGEVQP